MAAQTALCQHDTGQSSNHPPVAGSLQSLLSSDGTVSGSEATNGSDDDVALTNAITEARAADLSQQLDRVDDGEAFLTTVNSRRLPPLQGY